VTAVALVVSAAVVVAGDWASGAAALWLSSGVTSLRDFGVSRDPSLEDHVGLDALGGTGHGRYHCLAGTRVDCQDTNCMPWPRLAHRLWNRTCSERASPLTVRSNSKKPVMAARQP